MAVLCAFPSHAQTLSRANFDSAMGKKEALEKVRAYRSENLSRIHEIEKRRHEIISESNPGSLDQDVSLLKDTLSEHLKRQDFWDRLIFEIDTRFAGGDIREFLRSRLTEMAIVESSSADTTNLMKLFRYTSDVIKGSAERREDTLALVNGYVRSTNPTNPDEPQNYLSRQDYSNGVLGESARTMSKEDAAELADRRVNEFQPQGRRETERKTIAR